jgi:ABC-type multidrug transport system fused ATPase/permease subunit
MKYLAQQADINLAVPGGSGFENLTTLSFADLISYAIQLILIVAAVLFFFLLVLGGIRWITSGGDKGQTEAARNQITAALVGLVIVFAAWAIVQLVETFFGVRILSGLDINP